MDAYSQTFTVVRLTGQPAVPAESIEFADSNIISFFLRRRKLYFAEIRFSVSRSQPRNDLGSRGTRAAPPNARTAASATPSANPVSSAGSYRNSNSSGGGGSGVGGNGGDGDGQQN